MFSDRRKRQPEEARSKFERWILIQGGTAKVGTMLGLHQVTVGKWITRKTVPTLWAACRILELAGGELTLQDILDGTLPQ